MFAPGAVGGKWALIVIACQSVRFWLFHRRRR